MKLLSRLQTIFGVPVSEGSRGVRYLARVPMFAAALAFALGILAERFYLHAAWYWVAGTVLLAMFAIVAATHMQRAAYTAALGAMVFAGGFVSYASKTVVGPPHTVVQFATNSPVVITGSVVRDGVVRKHDIGADDESVDINVESVVTDAGEVTVAGGARITVYVPRAAYESDDSSEGEDQQRAPALRQFVTGERVRLTAKLHRPTNYRNPGAFDYVSYLAENGIHVLGSAKSDSIEVLQRVSGSRISRMRAQWRRNLIGKIHQIWPYEEAVYLDAMLVGERAFLSRGVRTEFQRAGTYHVLVVSGMNVAIFAVLLLWLLRRLHLGVALSAIITIVVAGGYAFVTDLSAPVMRSLVMIVVYQLAKLLYRHSSALNAVGVAAVLLLAIAPGDLFDASFQLTILSVIAIGGIAVPLLDRTTDPYRRAVRQLGTVGYDQAFAPKLTQWRIDLRMISDRLGKLVGRRVALSGVAGIVSAVLGVAELVLVSALMQVALALPMVWYFHRLPLRAFWANLVVVPATGVLMHCSALALALSPMSMNLAALPAKVAGWSLVLISNTVHTLASVAPEQRFATPSLMLCIVAAAGVAIALLVARWRVLLCWLGIAALTASSALLVYVRPTVPATGKLEVTAIDVGQGEALLIVTPEGKTVLLDSGGMLGFSRSEFDIGEDVTSSYLWNRGIDHLDAVAFSHPHSDHIGGMRSVIRNFRPREIWFGRSNDGPIKDELLKVCAEQNVATKMRSVGDAFHFGGADFEVLAPSADLELKKRQEDNESMVLRAKLGSTAMLLTGDIHREVEATLAHDRITANVLKVPHHGSATSTSPEFLKSVSPQFAVISAGQNNPFRHPRPEVLERLAAAAVKTYRTDLLGPVTVVLDGKTATVSFPH